MERALEVAAIGAGGHAMQSVLPNLSAAGLSLKAVCTTSEQSAERAAQRFGAQAAFTSAEKMIETTRLDGVVIVVPPEEYAPLVELAVGNGIPVFTEKPGARSAQEADELAAAASAKSVPVVVGYQKRFAPAYQRAKDLIERDDFGVVTGATLVWSMGPMGSDFDGWLFENPVHHLDLARFLLGELEDLHVIRSSTGKGHSVLVAARSRGGAPVSLHLGTTGSWRHRSEFVEVRGEGTSVVVENVDTCTWRPSDQPELVSRPNYTVPLAQNTTAVTMGFTGALAHFRAVVEGGVASASDMVSAAATLRLTQGVAERASRRA